MLKRSTLALLVALILGSMTWLLAQPRNTKLTADDYVEIQQLYARYNNAIDSGDGEAYAATFVPEGTFNTLTGHDALVGFIHNWRQKMGGANQRHWNTNLTITPAPEGASGSVYLLLVDVGARPPAILAAATYEDQLIKTAAGWRFKKRVTHNEDPPRTAAVAGKK